MLVPKAVTHLFFNIEKNRQALAKALKSFGFKRHVGPDELIGLMEKLGETGITQYVHIPHYHQVTDFEGKTVAEILRYDADGNLTLTKVRSVDLLQLLSLCMQLFDEEFNRYVFEWSHGEVMCIGEEEEEL